jgi:hypothetical protein
LELRPTQGQRSLGIRHAPSCKHKRQAL